MRIFLACADTPPRRLVPAGQSPDAHPSAPQPHLPNTTVYDELRNCETGNNPVFAWSGDAPCQNSGFLSLKKYSDVLRFV
jgi:hypothetical protein